MERARSDVVDTCEHFMYNDKLYYWEYMVFLQEI